MDISKGCLYIIKETDYSEFSSVYPVKISFFQPGYEKDKPAKLAGISLPKTQLTQTEPIYLKLINVLYKSNDEENPHQIFETFLVQIQIFLMIVSNFTWFRLIYS